jgi:hypothetical protein
VNAEAGACITAQILGAYNRFKAILALLTLHERNSQMKTAALTETAKKLMGKANLPGEQRNRHVHDPWYVFTGHDVPGQFKAMAHKDYRFGIHPTDLDNLEKTIKDIHDFADEVVAFRSAVLKMLLATALVGPKGGE